MTSPFHYGKRLDRGEIRLLRFNKRDEDEGLLNLDLISGCLPGTVAPRNSFIPYVALSYVWGKPTDREKEVIINNKACNIDNQIFKVKINLERALLHLEKNISLPIWIDGVCINQGDSDEKKKQVLLMTEIYDKAEQTIIWLGEGGNTTDGGRLIKFLDKIGEAAKDVGIDQLTQADVATWPDFGGEESKIALRTKLEELFPKMREGYGHEARFSFDELDKISHVPWFTRVWVLQELAVSNDFIFMYGKWTVPGNHFVAGLMFCYIWWVTRLRSFAQTRSLFDLPSTIWGVWRENGFSFLWHTLDRIYHYKPLGPSPQATRTIAMRKIWRQRPQPKLKRQLCQVFVHPVSNMGATDARDRIFALLGIAEDAGTLNIEPDYERDTKSVYIDVAAKLMEHGHIDILSLCRSTVSGSGPGPGRDWPSWVPDWENQIATPWGELLEDCLFYASGKDNSKSIPRPTYRPEDGVLVVKARSLGRLKKLGDPWNSNWGEKFNLDNATKLFLQVTKYLSSDDCAYSPEEREEAFWKIPIGDKEMNDIGIMRRATSKSHIEFKDMVAMMTRKFDRSKIPNTASYMTVMTGIYDARPFISDCGHVGLCPAASKDGDEIFIPAGAHVPYVFRGFAEGEGPHKLVGEAYVYGMMDGEAMKLDTQSQTLRLT